AELRNLHADTFAHLQRELENLQQQGGSPEALQQQVGALFTQTLPDLLKHSPALEVKELKLTTAQGDIDGNLLINFDGSGEPINPQNIFMLLQRLAIEADVSLPAQLAREL
ncbi:MAG: DUF945 family protein, partial [Burkholderiales bacterium]|nr:DUF945 family protein [Burkholderiales bacterium]